MAPLSGHSTIYSRIVRNIATALPVLYVLSEFWSPWPGSASPVLSILVILAILTRGWCSE